MPDERTKAERRMALLKDGFAVSRDVILLVLFLLLLFAPKTVNRALTDAGFTRGSIAGFDWEATIAATQKAGQAIAQVDADLGDVSAQLDAVAERVQDPAARRQVDSLASRIQTFREAAESADRSVKASLVTPENIAVQQPGWSKAKEGWIYLGRVHERKNGWMPGSPVTIGQGSPTPHEGQTLVISDPVYLRGDSPVGKHAAASVTSVLKPDEQVVVNAVEYSHARAGGWFVWVKVRRS